MERVDCPVPCAAVTDLRDEFDRYKEKTDDRLNRSDVTLATINTKLNWLIGILSALGLAVFSAVLKMFTG